MAKSRFPVPPPIKQAAPTRVGASGFLPSKPGTVLGRIPKEAVAGTRELTAVEREVVQRTGFTPGVGDHAAQVKVDTALAQQAEQLAEEAADFYGLTPLDPAAPPLEPPVPQPIETLPEHERARAEQIFREMDELQDNLNAARHQRIARKLPPRVMAKPGAQQAIEVALRAEEEANAKFAQQAPQTATPPPPFRTKAAPAAPDYPKMPFSTTAAGQNEDVAPSAPEAEVAAGATAGGDLPLTPTLCPRCGHDVREPVVAPSLEDKVAYLKALLEGTRFTKQFSLLGGRLRITFRGLTPLEVDAALREADKDMAAGETNNILQYARHAEGYKLAAGIAHLVRSQNEFAMPALGDIAEEPDEPTSTIRRMYDYFNNDVFTTDSLRRIVGAKWAEFNNLLKHLDEKVDDPDFFGLSG